MSSSEANDDCGCTTNAHDLAEVAKLKARLENAESNRTQMSDEEEKVASTGSAVWMDVPSVTIADGAHKYVQITATEPHPRPGRKAPLKRTFVVSKRGAAYHRNAAEPMVELLESCGFHNINVVGGGRIFCDDGNRKVSIFGYSYGFGRADHSLSKEVIEKDERYKNYEVIWSNDGY